MKLHNSVMEMKSELVELRRALHRIPEESYREFKTSQFIKDYLTALNPDSLTIIAKTGLKAVFDAGAEQTIAIRADMDALPIEEKNNFPHKSAHPGFMHACGHDGHMAVALCFAKLIAGRKASLKNNFVFIFQPAEETIGGAQQMIKEGVLANPRVDEIYGIHLWPDVPKGKIGLKDGPLMANMYDMNIRIIGKSAHGAAPQAGIDALLAAANFIVQTNSILSRNIDPSIPAVLNIGRLFAGDARNIVCEEATIEGTIRSFDDGVSELIKSRVKQIMKGIDHSFGTKSEYYETMGYPVLINNSKLYSEIINKFDDNEIIDVKAVMMAEDFAFFNEKTKGIFAFIGTGGEPLHSNTFNFNEEVLSNALEYYVRVCDVEQL
jgi:amidohydrolase